MPVIVSSGGHFRPDDRTVTIRPLPVHLRSSANPGAGRVAGAAASVSGRAAPRLSVQRRRTRGCTTMRRAVTRRGLAALAALAGIAALAPEAPAAAMPVPADAIVLDRTGGFAGSRDSFLVDGSTAGGQRARRLAAGPGFRRLRGSYQPA